MSENAGTTVATDTGNADVVRAFLAALERFDVDAAGALLDPDVVYENVSLPAAHGRAATLRLLRSMPRALSGFEARTHRLAATGPVVLTERTDVLVVGRVRVAFWVCGTFEVHDGRITLWRDYFDWAATTGALVSGVVRAVGSLLRRDRGAGDRPAAGPGPGAPDAEALRAINRRMVDTILGAEPEPYRDGGYVRRVVEIRGRRSGQVHAVPIAVVGLAGRRYLVSPVRDRNWVRNLLADPDCVVRSRDEREACRAAPVEDADRIADVVSAYVALMADAPWAIARFPFPADAARSRIRDAAGSMAVIELEPVRVP